MKICEVFLLVVLSLIVGRSHTLLTVDEVRNKFMGFDSNYVVFEDQHHDSNAIQSDIFQRRILRGKDARAKEVEAIKSLAERPVDRPLFQRCRDGGEAYSAAYLIHKTHLLEQKTNYNLTWVNCEMGSFIMMARNANPRKDVPGSVVLTVDVLDFSVIHLSAYERLQHRWRRGSNEIMKDMGNLSAIFNAAELLKARYELLHKTYSVPFPPEHDAMNRTVVVMPFLGSDMGAGHSKLANRQAYLSACFWSFYTYYPHVVAAVKSPKDRDYVLQKSGLPFYDVMLLEDLPKSASLPVATVQTTKARIMNGTWAHFDYVFFTESDQILMMRTPDDIYAYVDFHPRHMMLPHRLMAYPASVLQHYHHRQLRRDAPNDWMDMQCCLTRQYCEDRHDWQKVSNASAVSVVQVYGLQVPLGNSNFHSETYRSCPLRESHNMHTCP